MKKKHIIGLGTLLLVLLLGSFTTSYADELGTSLVAQTISLSNSSNVVTDNNYIKAIYETFNNNQSYFGLAETYFEQYDYFIVESLNAYSSGQSLEFYTRNIAIYFFNCPDNVNLRIVNSDFVFSSNIDYRAIRFRNGSINSNTTYNGNSLTLHLYQLVTNYDKEIYNDDSTLNSSINSAYNEGFVTSIGFTFIPKPSDTYASVWSYDDVPFYNASGEDLYIGQLFVPDGTVMEENNLNFYYRFGTWNHRYLPLNCYYLDYFSNIDDVVVYDVYLSKQFIYENTLYDLTISDKSVEPYNLAPIFFYIRNNYTVIANGVLDTSSTFSGDYKEQYDNEIQNEQDVNNISEAIVGTILDDSEVDNILHNFDTSGEVAAYFGYHDYTSDNDSPFYKPSLLITSVVESLIDELMRSGDRYVDITLPNGEQERIWARFFTTPDEGRGSAWILFVRWYLIFVTIYLMYRNLLEIGEEFTTFNVHGALDKIDVDRYVFRM